MFQINPAGRLKNFKTISRYRCYSCMFSFFKSDPIKKLEAKRKKLLEEAMHVQRSGDLKLYAIKMTAIDQLEKEIEALQTGK